MIDYKYNEDQLLKDIKDYIDSTYNQHYASTDKEGNNIQLNDIFIADGTGMPFFRNNAMKYLSRFGKKEGTNIKDLKKAIHYTVLMMYIHEKENTK